MVKIPYKTKTAFGTSVYANSITLTPGTVTVLVEDDHFVVHALTQEAADALKTGEMHRRVKAVEDAGSRPSDTSGGAAS